MKRTVLVTGGASGIGRGIADAFLAAGDRVIIADLATDPAEPTAPAASAAPAKPTDPAKPTNPADPAKPTNLAKPTGLAEPTAAASAASAASAAPAKPNGLAEYVTLDISDAAQVEAAIARHDPIDVLINNAGLAAGAAPLIDLDPEVFDHCVRVNFRGTFLMTKAVGAHMVANGTRGTIVNISSIGARQPTPGLGHYEATKAAVEALTRSAALELAPHGIRVNAVAPGPVLTPMTAGFAADTAARAAWEARIPLGTIASVADVVPSVLFLASADAGHLTGVSLQVDGGQLLT